MVIDNEDEASEIPQKTEDTHQLMDASARTFKLNLLPDNDGGSRESSDQPEEQKNTSDVVRVLIEEPEKNGGVAGNGEGKSESDSSLIVREDNYSIFGDSDGDDDVQAYFPCPFCYVDIEVPVFCSHLQDEHCFNLKNAVCPLCAANMGKDAMGHFIVQHSSSLKRRRKSEKFNVITGNSMFGKRLPNSSRGNKPEPMPDPLLSPFICNAPILSSDSSTANECSTNESPIVSDAQSGTHELDSDDEERHQERKQRAAFAQELISSTIF